MKLLIVAGGGGHFAPALAVIEALPKDWEVLVVGRKYAFEADKTLSFEYQTSEKLGIKFAVITTGRLQRKLSPHTIKSLVKVPVGFFQAVKIIKEYKPTMLLSFGGYVSVPVALAAKSLGIPIIVHEQIMGAGLANKIVEKLADKICVSWKQSEKFFPAAKVVLTGNPLRKVENSVFPFQVTEKLPIIYVTGGSGGSHAINVLVENCLEQLLENYNIIHQTGAAAEFGDFDRLEKKKNKLPPALQKRYFPTKFIDASAVFSVLRKADLVVSRSGINTVTELLSLGKPCLFIPLPHGQHNEQLTNALFVKQLGLGEAAEQKSLTAQNFHETIDKMMVSLETYTAHAQEGKAMVIPDAAQKIITLLEHGHIKKEITKS